MLEEIRREVKKRMDDELCVGGSIDSDRPEPILTRRAASLS